MKKHLLNAVMIIAIIATLTISAFASGLPSEMPDNPTALSEYSYYIKYTVKLTDNTEYLNILASNSPFTIQIIENEKYMRYSQSGARWNWNNTNQSWTYTYVSSSSTQVPLETSAITKGTILESSHDLYLYGDPTTVFFSRPRVTPLVLVAKTLTPQMILTQILTILPVVVGLVILFLALRKALAMLWKALSQA